jgi:hypothetical protein
LRGYHKDQKVGQSRVSWWGILERQDKGLYQFRRRSFLNSAFSRDKKRWVL